VEGIIPEVTNITIAIAIDISPLTVKLVPFPGPNVGITLLLVLLSIAPAMASTLLPDTDVKFVRIRINEVSLTLSLFASG